MILQNRPAPRRGFALPAAVFALGLIGVLVTGGFFIARQETRIGVANDKGITAFYLAERGVNDVLDNWPGYSFGEMAYGDTAIVADTTSDGRYRVRVERLSDWLYYLDSEATVTKGGAMLNGASRRVGTLAKVRTIDIRPPAALTTIDGLTIGGSSMVVGMDSIPAEWRSGGWCDPSDLKDSPGVMIDDTSGVAFSGTRYELHGDPPMAEDPTLDSDRLLTHGDLTWEQLVDLANIRLAPGTNITQTDPDSIATAGGYICNRTNPRNWGDPLNPGGVCGGNFPIIYGQGDLDIQSDDYGQGILLVEGDLKLTGGYNFYGPVIVRGTVSTTGTGGHVHGGLIAANVELETTTVLGNALVQYSSCSVTRALLNNSRLTFALPLAERSWIDLTNVGS